MSTCPQCNGINRRQATHCRHCGAQMSVTCPHCRTVNRPNAAYCAGCRANLRLPGAPQNRAGTGSLTGGALLNGRYMIKHKIAQGGMGAIYQVVDTHQPSAVWALKEMSVADFSEDEQREAVGDFHREADLLQKLNHPNLVKVIERFSQSGKEYLVMEYIEGDTLDTITNGGLLPESDVLGIALQLCNVLEYLHKQSPPIIYRDLKPSNVMQEKSTGLLKLIDFGIVRFYKPGQKKDTTLLGTPGFAPPEQWGKGQTDARSDVFAFGVMVHVLLTNFDVSQNPWSYPPASTLNPNVSTRLEQVIQKATQMDQAKRYQSIDELRTALMRCKDAKRIAAALPTGKGASSAPILQPVPPPRPAPVASGGNPLTPVLVPNAPSPRAVPAQSKLDVQPGSLQLSVPYGEKNTQQLLVTSSDNSQMRVQIHSSSDWIQPEPVLFVDASETISLTIETGKLQLPTRVKRTPPNIIGRSWAWAENKGASRRPWNDFDDLGMTLAAGLPALILGGLVQALVWLLYQHAYYWVPGSARHSETVEISYRGGLEMIPVDIEVKPNFWQQFFGWAASGMAVSAEVVLLLLMLYWFVFG